MRCRDGESSSHNPVGLCSWGYGKPTALAVGRFTQRPSSFTALMKSSLRQSGSNANSCWQTAMVSVSMMLRHRGDTRYQCWHCLHGLQAAKWITSRFDSLPVAKRHRQFHFLIASKKM